MARRLKLGLALGTGAAKGWAHIGVIRALEEHGLVPDIVTGTSAGALVGGAYVAGYLDELEAWVRSLRWSDVVALLDFRFSGGLIRGNRVINHLREGMHGLQVEELPIPYAAVATDLDFGTEVWLREGPLLDAIRASIALPGLFSPLRVEGRWLVDGGLVNPVPVSLCRALGADVVIAVDLTLQAQLARAGQRLAEKGQDGAEQDWFRDLLQGMLGRFRAPKEDKDLLPSLIDVAVRSVNIMTERIARSRMAGDPADLLIMPRVADISLMEFHRANEAIPLGYEAAQRHGVELERLRTYLDRAR